MGLINIVKSIYDICENQIALAGIEEEQDHAAIIAQPIQLVRQLQAEPAFDPNNLVMSAKGDIELANYEGLAQTKYYDSDSPPVQTIGIGMTVSEISDLKSWAWDKQLTVQQCCDMFKQGLLKYQNALNKAVTVPLTQNQFDALLSLTYNIGIGAMQGSTIIKRVNARDSYENIANAFLNWKYGSGRVVQVLVNRRNFEREVFLTGKYQNNGTVALISVDPSTHKPSYKNHINLLSYF
jgi:lysozyme